ncbi:MAG TPA: MlaD family protein [Kiritimatiellia bacterium]|nr:MlaD family protein [Kiritimatiellia bacterium]
MSKKANPTLVGSFVVGAIALSVIGIMVLGGGSFMEERFTGIMYFDESISGLDVGAPVDFQGVRIGTVTGVRMEMDAAEEGAVFRPVTFQIEFNRIYFRGGRKTRGDEVREQVERLVQEKGFRARLATQSMLTGKLKIEMGYFPGTPIDRKHRDLGLWEMPTIPSPLAAVKREVQDLPLTDIIQEAYRVVKNVGYLLDPEKTGQTMAALNATLNHLDSVIQQIRDTIQPITSEGVGAIVDVRTSLQDLQSIFKKIDENIQPMLDSMTDTSYRVGNLLDPESPMRGEINLLIAEVRETSKSIRLLTEYLEQHPEALVRGKR